MWLSRHGYYNSVTATVPVAQKQIADKSRELKAADYFNGSSKSGVDLITKFLQAKVDNPEIVDDRAVLGLTLSIVNAGSGTISTTMAAVFYFLLKHPPVMSKLIAEIDAHFPPPTDKTSPVNFTEQVILYSKSQELPFLDAVIKEIFRLWPGLGAQLIERVTPPEGAHIIGEFIPGNIIVSCNAWIMHRHKPTYGEDVEVFRPERWLEASQEQIGLMNKTLLVFGAGPNTCIGKNIAFLELYKAVPSILRVFEVSGSFLGNINCIVTHGLVV
jgi:cytochrome P450